MIHRSIRLALVPAVVMTAGACFATRNDVRTLQGDIAILRAENLRADSVHRAHFQQATVQIGAVSDSLRSLNAFLARFVTDVSRFQGDLTINMHTFGQQLIAIQELTGQNIKKLQDVKVQFERQEAELATAAQPSASPAVQGSPGGPPPGPAQLFELGRVQLGRGAYSAARAAFEPFLEQYPTNERAAEAQFSIARSFDLDGNAKAADSVYAMVVEKYPKTDFAPNALYKRAMLAKQSGQIAIAKKYFQQIIDSYPRSMEATLAPAQLAPDPLKKP